MKPILLAAAAAILSSLLCASGLLAQGPERPATMPLPPALHVQCLETLRQALQSAEFWPAMHAAEALTLAGKTDEVRAALADRWANEHDDQRRCGLARELVRAGNREPLTTLAQILADPSSTGRVHAAESLYKLGEVGAGEALRAAHKQGKNQPLQLWAAAALAKSGDKKCLAELRTALRSGPPASRATAAFVLARVGDTGDVSPLASALATETDPLARVMLAGALACLGNAGGRVELGLQLESEDAATRAIAADFVGASRSLEYQPKLVVLLKDRTLDVRVRAAQSLIALSQPVTTAQSR